MNAVSFHDYADLLAFGSLKQIVRVMDLNGSLLNTIRYHDGFLGQRIGPVNCLAFHPYKPLLVCGGRDRYVSIVGDES